VARTLASVCLVLEGIVVLVWSLALLSTVSSTRSSGFRLAIIELAVATLFFGLAMAFWRSRRSAGRKASGLTRVAAVLVALLNGLVATSFLVVAIDRNAHYLLLRLAGWLLLVIPLAFVGVVGLLATFRTEGAVQSDPAG
jgi:hypothetical protein